MKLFQLVAAAVLLSLVGDVLCQFHRDARCGADRHDRRRVWSRHTRGDCHLAIARLRLESIGDGGLLTTSLRCAVRESRGGKVDVVLVLFYSLG